MRLPCPGTWGLTTSQVNGYTFGATGEISSAQGFNPEGAFPQTVTVLVPVAAGQALVYGTGIDKFVMSTTTSKTASNRDFNILLTKGGYKLDRVDCSTPNLIIHISSPTAMQSTDTLLNGKYFVSDAYIKIPIIVTAPGQYVVYADVAGALFATCTLQGSKYVINPVTLTSATSTLTLYPVGNLDDTNPNRIVNTSILNTNIPIKFSAGDNNGPDGVAGNADDWEPESGYYQQDQFCVPSVVVKPSVAKLSSITFDHYVGGVTTDSKGNPISGFYLVNSLSGGTNTPVTALVMNISVSTQGELNLSSTFNGITYSFSGNVTPSDTQITLNYSGDTPEDFGKVNYTYTYYKTGDADTPTGSIVVPVYFGIRQMKVVSYGDNVYTMNRPVATNGTGSNGYAIIMSTDNFGPTGIMPSLGFTVTIITSVPTATTMQSQLADADIVFVNYPEAYGDPTLIPTLKAFNDGGGVVIYSNQNGTDDRSFYNTFYPSNTLPTTAYSGAGAVADYNLPIGTLTRTGTTGTVAGTLTPMPVNDPIGNGLFNKNASLGFNVNLTYMWSESTNTSYMDVGSNIGANLSLDPNIIAISRVTGNGHDYYLAWYDPVKGVMFNGDSGWTRGDNLGPVGATPFVIKGGNGTNASPYYGTGALPTSTGYSSSGYATTQIFSSGISYASPGANTSQNGYIFANTIAWAMKWVAMHKP